MTEFENIVCGVAVWIRLMLKQALRIAAGLTFSTALFAHETWLMPEKFSVPLQREVRLDLTSGSEFPKLDAAINSARVTEVAYRIGGQVGRISLLEPGENSLVLRQAFPGNGVATVWVSLLPREIELEDNSVVEYLKEINAAEEVRSIWARRMGKTAWKEIYTKHAKTHIAVGNAVNDMSWKMGVGSALELVLGKDPFSVRVGDEIAVQLLASSKPLPKVSIGLLIEGGDERLFQVPDAAGWAKFKIPRSGRATFFAVNLRPAADEDSWQSDFANLTFYVRPAK